MRPTYIVSLVAFGLFNQMVLADLPAGASGMAGAMMQMVPLILIFLVMYFLLIRPQQKRHKQHVDMLSQIEKNDQIVTNGGLVGIVVQVENERLKVEIADGVVVETLKSAISQVLTANRPALKKIEQIKRSHGKTGNKPVKKIQKKKENEK